MAHAITPAEEVRRAPAPRPKTCAVCAGDEVHVDHVRHQGWIELSECARCGHRWTAPAPGVPRARRAGTPPRDRLSEVAHAA